MCVIYIQYKIFMYRRIDILHSQWDPQVTQLDTGLCLGVSVRAPWHVPRMHRDQQRHGSYAKILT